MKYIFYCLVPIVVIGFFVSIVFSKNLLNTSRTRIVTINNQRITVEIADTDTLRSQGLSGRESLAKDRGMLFVYQKPGIYSFWMKDMQFPLDFIWINGDTVVDLTKDIPVPETEDLLTLPNYQPNTPVDKILELNVGSIAGMNIKIGDKIEY